MDEALRKDTLELIREIRRVRMGSTRFLAKALEPLRLNIPQYTALTVLDEKGEINMGALADGLGVTMGAGTNMVDGLIDAGFVTRVRGTDDRRIVRVKLTEQGKNTLAKAIDAGVSYVAPYLVEVPQEERKAFTEAFRKLADRLTVDLVK